MKKLICTVCPMGCALTVTKDETGALSVSGNSCPRGARYGLDEVTNPKRTVTSSVFVAGGDCALVSVRTAQPVSKAKIPDVLSALAALRVQAPLNVGDVLLENIAGTGVSLIATRRVSRA